MKLSDRCAAIRLMLSDVDGVLTDGRLIYDNQGGEAKQFHIRDGQGIRLWQQSGGTFGIVTARSSAMVTRRAEELDITLVKQGVKNKLAEVQEIAIEFGCDLKEICYVGDDVLDWATIQSVGLGVAVADAVEEVRQSAKYVTSQPGGHGAIRELIELLLKNTNRWESTIHKYQA